MPLIPRCCWSSRSSLSAGAKQFLSEPERGKQTLRAHCSSATGVTPTAANPALT